MKKATKIVLLVILAVVAGRPIRPGVLLAGAPVLAEAGGEL